MKPLKYALLMILLIGFGCIKRVDVSDVSTSQDIDQVQYAWVEFGIDQRLIARAIVDQASASHPVISIDGQAPQPMALRVASNSDFPIDLYEYPIDPKAASAVIWQQISGAPTQSIQLKLLPANPSRILLIGDTGCRIKDSKVQDCNDPAKWPFGQVAEMAAAQKPDLVIHVGDYHYRETGDGCTPSAKCGDNWPSWQADFFEPSKSLLEAAPWVFVRGNHEICGRGGEGWTRLLDPHPYEPCGAFKPPYSVDLDGIQFLVLDVADTDSYEGVNQEQLPILSEFFQWVGEAAGPIAVLVNHIPIWDFYPGSTPDATLQAALGGALNHQLPLSIELEIAGHNHLFRWVDFDQSNPIKRAPEFIVGNGGTEMDSDKGAVLAGTEIDGVIVSHGQSDYLTFGFCVFDPSAKPWTIVRFDVNGAPVQTYSIDSGQVTTQ